MDEMLKARKKSLEKVAKVAGVVKLRSKLVAKVVRWARNAKTDYNGSSRTEERSSRDTDASRGPKKGRAAPH